MKKLYSFALLFFFSICIYAAPVNEDIARKAAFNFLMHYSKLKSGIVDLSAGNLASYKGTTTCYIFSLSGGGWIIISADDAATPVLGYATSGEWNAESLNPTAQKWMENYNREIYQAIQSGQNNTISQNEWQSLLNQQFNDAVKTVSPLVKTNWDQSRYYNDLCPPSSAAPSGYGGHVPTGCVATTMAQIMKYHAYPAQGLSTKTYIHPVFGALSANFGSTDYNWTAMPDKATATNSAIATLMYHCGVAVSMNYSPEASGALSEVVPHVMKTYFNYDESIQLLNREDMTTDEIWRTHIRTELDASRPIYYAGSGSAGGHAFVCDGYDASNPTKFHINWGWSGSNNGYFAIGALNTNNGSFNEFNRIITGIKPRTSPDYVCRIENPTDGSKIDSGTDINISVTTIRGNTAKVVLLVDGVRMDSSSVAPFSLTVSTSGMVSGPHLLSIKATDGTSWDSHQASINILSDCWQLQSVTFSMDSVNIEQIFPVDENVVWAVLRDYSSKGNSIRKYIKTTNGGTTWTEGTISCTNCSSKEISNIYAFSANKAYACLNPGSATGGSIMVTEDGGTTWTAQASATFSGSWANWVYFFDSNNGVCMGDSYKAIAASNNYQFCIYTTSDGGTNWNRVSTANLPAALSNEAGTVNFFDAVDNTIWFGTGNGRVYKSTDKGLTWTVKDGVLGTVQTNVRFRDINNGFAFGGLGTGNFGFKRTKDGGNTWTDVAPTGSLAGQDFEYITGTDSTWINTGSYSAISVSDNSSYYWLDYNINLRTSKFFSPTSGWGGGYYSIKDGGGIYKWTGSLSPAYNRSAVLRVKDAAGNPVSGATALISNQFKTTDVDGLASFVIRGFGNPEYYKVTKSGYSSRAANAFIKDNDTIDVQLLPASTVTFTVKNKQDELISGATVIFNGLSQTTDANGATVFSNVNTGSYPFAVTKTKFYAGYGMLDIKDETTNQVIVLTSDGTPVKKVVKQKQVVFPNPASDVLNVLSEEPMSAVEIVSMQGKILYRKTCDSNTLEIPVTNIQDGEYILRISQGKTQESQKIIIRH